MKPGILAFRVHWLAEKPGARELRRVTFPHLPSANSFAAMRRRDSAEVTVSAVQVPADFVFGRMVTL